MNRLSRDQLQKDRRTGRHKQERKFVEKERPEIGKKTDLHLIGNNFCTFKGPFLLLLLEAGADIEIASNQGQHTFTAMAAHLKLTAAPPAFPAPPA